AVETTDSHPDTLVGTRFSESAWWSGSPEGRRRLERARKRALAGVQTSFHAELGTKAGPRLMEVTLTPIREDDGSIPSFVVSATDIGERQAIASQLQESEERFREVAHSASFLVWMSDEQGEFSFVNEPWLAFTGRRLEQELGQGWKTALHPSDRRRALTEYYSAIEGRSPFSVECRFRDQRRVDSWFVFRGGPRYRSDGVLTGFMGVCISIADQKRLEGELRASLEEKEVLLREVHHRVKNNLQVISSLLRLQARMADHPEAVRILEDSEHRLQTMALVHESIYRSETMRIGASEYLTSLLEQLTKLHATARTGIEVEAHFDDLEIDLDRAIPLALILNELVSNSLEHAFGDDPELRGKVSVSLRADAEAVTLEVVDDGFGIPEEIDWRETESLGLRLVRLLGQQVQATVEVSETKPGTDRPGTRVRLSRPRGKPVSGSVRTLPPAPPERRRRDRR
ncbi:MAG: histidine kinase dimerization/phosphoacceptor domain -containing protein, partial [Acidobacteriota bacterium]